MMRINQMVSRLRGDRRRPSRARLLAAAAAEFAARGFDGAKVDRIARRARVNKAMVYYHFASKAALYRAVLGEVFQGVAAAVARDAEAGGDPADQLRRFVRVVEGQMAAHPHLPPIWLREVADGGRHLDAVVLGHLTDVLAALRRILDRGASAGVFRPSHPFVVQISIVAPLLLVAASAPLREQLRRTAPYLEDLDRETVVTYVESAALAALGPSAPSSPVPARVARRRSVS
ncbi:MAG: TetR/AcrR family transcriptional regulator [Acidobacteria bacterium]|nr:TetR/AcrR family transcriptional regulator [Acidobacteriota bacterium]